MKLGRKGNRGKESKRKTKGHTHVPFTRHQVTYEFCLKHTHILIKTDSLLHFEHFEGPAGKIRVGRKGTEGRKVREKQKDLSSLTLSSLFPMRQTAFRVGTQRLNSFIQLCRVDLGTRTMWGPGMFL